MATNNNGYPPTLLPLPRELRDEIYGYLAHYVDVVNNSETDFRVFFARWAPLSGLPREPPDTRRVPHAMETGFGSGRRRGRR